MFENIIYREATLFMAFLNDVNNIMFFLVEVSGL